MSYRQLWIIKLILLLCLGLSLAAAGRVGYQVVSNARQSALETRVDKLKSNLEEISPVKTNYHQAAAELPEVQTKQQYNFFVPLQQESAEEKQKEVIPQPMEDNSSPAGKPSNQEEKDKKPEKTAKSEPKQEPVSLAVAAISIYGAGERNMAILKDKKTNEIYLVKQGMTINGYQVAVINKQSVTLKQGEKKISLTLPDGEDE